MADQLPPPDDNGIQWKKATSKNGVPFEVGSKTTENPIDKSEAATRATSQAGRYPVYWPVGDQSWKTTPEVEHFVDISRYRLYRTTGIYDYRLEFTNVRGWDFNFWDQSGDLYTKSTLINGDHYIRYSSSSPTIRFVSQS
jgi:hypothetical protein